MPQGFLDALALENLLLQVAIGLFQGRVGAPLGGIGRGQGGDHQGRHQPENADGRIAVGGAEEGLRLAFQIDRAQPLAIEDDRGLHLDQTPVIARQHRRGQGRRRRGAVAFIGRHQGAGHVVHTALLDLRIGAQGADIFLGGGAVVEGQSGCETGGQGLGLDLGFTGGLGAEGHLVEAGHGQAGREQHQGAADGQAGHSGSAQGPPTGGGLIGLTHLALRLQG